ncbi:MAG: hypothetical protein CMP49_06115, partial [Flavobacteriales bacterium]|nr:hypothetical protein [Flavobacteriales bacterium]
QDDLALTAGDYTTTVTDDNGCQAEVTFTIDEPALLEISVETTDASCNGGSDGSAIYTITGGSEPYSIVEDQFDLSLGTYTTTVTDSNDCQAEVTFTIDEPALLEISVETTDVSCNGGSDGSVIYTVTGGTSPYDVEDQFDLTSGTYTTTVTDSNGCQAEVTFAIDEPTVLEMSVETVDVECNGSSSGSAILTFSGGTSPYTINGVNVLSGYSITELSAGTYQETLIDANNCELTIEFNIVEISAIELSTAQSIDCPPNSSSLFIEFGSAFGGTPPYIYTWTFSPFEIPAGFEDDYPLEIASGEDAWFVDVYQDGVYTILAEDAVGCETLSVIEFDSQQVVLDYELSSPACPDECNGVVIIEPNGAFDQEDWTIFYSSNDLDQDGELSLTPPNPLTPFIISVNDDDIDGDGDNNDDDVDIDGDGDYDENGDCIANCNDNPSLFEDSDIFPTAAIYSDYVEIPLNNEGLFQIDNLCPGSYYAIAVQGYSDDDPFEDPICESYLIYFDVTEYEEIIIEAVVSTSSSGDEIQCYGDLTGSIDLTVTGGSGNYIYSWTNGETTQDLIDISAGTYTVTVTDDSDSDCEAIESFILNEPEELVITLDEDNTFIDLLCNGDNNGNIDIFITGGSPPYSFIWSNGATTQNIGDLVAGSYSVTVTDLNNCVVSEEWSVTEPNQINILLDENNSLVDLLCYGDNNGNIDILLEGGTPPYSFSWSTGEITQNISGLEAGEYSVSITDVNNCETVTETFAIIQPDELILESVSLTDSLDCYNDTDGFIDLIVGGGVPPYSFIWSNGATTQSISELDAGFYTVTITDSNNCSPIIADFLIEEPDELIISFNEDNSFIDLLCYGDNNGNINLSVNGGTPPYSFDWSNGATTQNIDNLSSDLYSITITDVNGCVVSDEWTVAETEEISINLVLESTNLGCYGDTDGNIDISVNGGTGEYIYEWSNGEVSEDIENLTFGTYTVTVFDENGCQNSESYDINEPVELILETEFATEDLGCYGDNNGVIDILVSGGTGNYTYEWSNGEITQDINGLSSGTYSINVFDENFCIVSEEYIITEPNEILISTDSESFLDLLCFGDSDGFIDISVSGGSGGFSYEWSNGEVSEDISNLDEGEYTVTVTDSDGCSNFLEIIVSQPDDILLNGNVTSLSCDGNDTGSIDLIPSGGSGDYTYIWSNGQDTEDISNLEPGTYSVTIIDSNGCEESDSFEVVGLNNNVEIQIDNIENSSCFSFNFNNGSIDISVVGGSGLFQYTWTGNNGFSQISFFEDDVNDLSAGLYTISVLDIVDGCVYTYGEQIEITEPAPIEFDLDIDNDGFINSYTEYTEYVCSNECSGQINFTIGGGVSPYNFELYNIDGDFIQDSNSGVFNGLCEGCYYVDIYDSNWNADFPDGCYAQYEFCILENSPFINADIVPAGCNPTGSATFTFSDGLPPYDIMFSLNNSLFFEEINFDLNTLDFSDLVPGDYELTIEDDLDCATTYSFSIETLVNDIDIVDIEAVNPTCPNDFGSVNIEFTNSLSGEDLFGSISIVQDLNSDCFLNDNEIILDEIIIEGSTNTTISTSINNLSGGDYIFIIEDFTGCLVQSCVSIISIPEFTPEVYLSCSGPNTCFEESGSATVSSDPLDVGGTPPYEIEWFDFGVDGIPFNSDDLTVTTVSPDALVATSLSAGDYYVIITDSNDCQSIATCSITEPPTALIAGVSSSSPFTTCCDSNDGEIVIQPYGGVGDFYIVDVNYSNSFAVSVPINFVNSFNNPLLIEPGVNDTYILSDVYPGEYEIIVHDSDSENLDICLPDTANFVITVPECIDWTIVTDPLPCYGDVIVWSDIDGLDGNFYNYTGGVGPADIYWFPQGSSMGNMNNAVDNNNIGPGTYNILSIDAAGCETVHGPITIPYTPELQSDFNIYDSETSIYCHGDNTGIIAINTYYSGSNGEFIEANDPITYLWSYNGQYVPEYDNLNIIDSLPAGIYDVSINNSNDCGPILLPSIEIIEPDSPLSASYSTINNDCYGESNGAISLNPSGGSLNTDEYEYLYFWTGTSLSGDNIDLSTQVNNQNLENLIAGNYSCYISVNNPDDESFINSCEYTIEIPVTEQPLLELSTIENPISCDGYEDGSINLIVSGGTPPYVYQWSSGQISQDINNLGAGFYTVSVNDANNCGPVFISVELFDPNPLTYNPDDETVVVPANCFYGNTNSGQIAIHTENLWSQLQGGTGPYSDPEIALVLGDCSNTIEGYLSNNNDSIIFDNLSGGIYTICVDDANGCYQSYNVSIPIVNDLSVDVGYELINATCGENGSIYISSISTNGVPPFDIIINSINNPSVSYNFLSDGINQWFEADGFDSSSPYILSNSNYGFNFASSDWNGNDIDDISSIDIDGDGIINDEDWDIDGDEIYNNDDLTPYGDNGIDPDFNNSEFGWHQVPPGEYEILITDSQGCTGSQSIYVDIIDNTPSFSASTQAGNCYWDVLNSCDSLSNNGSLIINSTSLSVNTLYPYEIYIDGELYDIVMADPGWEDENYVIPLLEAGTAYSVEIYDANGCGYSNNSTYFEIPFLSALNVEIQGFCPECQESSSGGFAYTFFEIQDEILSGLNPDVQIQTFGPLTNSEIDILYTNTNLNTTFECLDDVDIDNDGILNNMDDDIDGDGWLNYGDDGIQGVDDGLGDDDPDIDGDGILNDDDYSMSYNYDGLNIIQLENLEDDFYFIDNMWWDNIPDPNVLVDYHQDYLNIVDNNSDYMIAGLSYGTYDITIIDEYGCQFTQEIDISDENCNNEFGSQQWENCLFIPSVFTPNGDGINDLWDIYNIELYEESGVRVTVFNRWGQIVYQNIESNELNGTYSDKLWTGKNMNGVGVEIATYYYVIEIDEFDKNYTGYVVVKR